MTGTDRIPLVAPFVGERFADAGRLSALLAPPYDVITPGERKQLATEPENIVHLILPEGDPSPYAAAQRTLARWRDRQTVVPDTRPTLTVVRQWFETPDGSERVRTGVIGGVVAEAFATGRVKPHERTHAGPKEDRLSLVRATRVMFEALLFFARDESGALQELLQSVVQREPDARAEIGSGKLALWVVDSDLAERVSSAADQGPLYIGDGHHRYETAITYRTENPSAARLPGLIVPLRDPGVTVLPTHRLVHGAPVDPDGILAEVRQQFRVSELWNVHEAGQELASLAERGTACVLLLPGRRAVTLLLEPGEHLDRVFAASGPVVSTLDVVRIDQTVVAAIIEAAGSGARVGYSARAEDVMHQVESGAAAAGVLLNPTRLAQVLEVADAGQVMPQKSTYFMPKVPSGIVGMDYDSERIK